MATLDDEFKKTLAEHARGVAKVDEGFAFATVRLMVDSIDSEEEIWTLTAAEAEKRARKLRMVAAHSLRVAAICDEHADAVSLEPIVVSS